MTRRAILLLGAVAAAGAVIAGAAGPWAGAPRSAEGWQEVAWPHPRDAWPAGHAYRCRSAACGGAVDLTVRAKVGFCNCATGVTDDAEVDAVSDLDLVSADYRPEQPGEPVTVGGMAGRTRRYTLYMPDGSARPAAGFAVSSRCDLVVAASHGQAAGSPAAQRAIAGLLGSAPVLAWLRPQLGKG